MHNLFGAKKHKKSDRRSGRHIPHVGRIPRSRTSKGNWRKKRSDTGKTRRSRSLFGF